LWGRESERVPIALADPRLLGRVFEIVAVRDSEQGHGFVVLKKPTTVRQLRREWWVSGGDLVQLRHRLRRPVTLDFGALYEAHAARASTDEEIVGSGDFERVGRIELAILVNADLRANDVLVDIGCGSGRLALLSCLALELEAPRQIFRDTAALSLSEDGVRPVTSPRRATS
jgi:hypothetical protein